MNSELITQIFEICIIPLLAILTRYAIKFINIKSNELAAKTDNMLAKKYTEEIAETIVKCIEATNQTYVNSLKQQGSFDKEAQKVAFNKTLNAVLLTLGDEAKNYISESGRDLTTYLTQLIESSIEPVKNGK